MELRVSFAYLAFFVMLLLSVGVQVGIGVYVWRDAKSRNMNALLWTLLAVLAPSMIGFILYLLIRGSYSNLKCPNCGTSINERFAVCPGCGTPLRAACPSCGCPAEPGWKICPRCAAPLPEQYADVCPPTAKKDKTLWIVLTAAIAVPVVLLVGMLVLMTLSMFF